MSFSTISADVNPIISEYEQLSLEYDKQYLAGNSVKAMSIALEQLNMDPSDSVAFMRLALSVKESCDQVHPYFNQFGSKDEFKSVTSLAKLVIKKECKISLK